MLTDAQQAAGALRMQAGKLTASDQSDLLGIFRLWLGSRARSYPSLGVALAGAVTPTADKLAGTLILLKTMNFSVSAFEGGRLGLQSKKTEKRDLIIRYAFALLFELPTDLTGESYESCSGSVSVPVQAGW